MVVNVFVSYARDDVLDDKNLIDEFLKHGKARQRNREIEIFKDTERIDFGDVWKSKIDSALNQADIALLFISANFIASDFIFEHELKVLLQKHKDEGIVIMPILLGFCEWDIIEDLAQFQIFPDPNEPLRSMNTSVFEGKAMEFFSQVMPRRYPLHEKTTEALSQVPLSMRRSEEPMPMAKLTPEILINEIEQEKGRFHEKLNIANIYEELIQWGQENLVSPNRGEIKMGQYNPKHKLGSASFIYCKNGSFQTEDRYHLFRISINGGISPSFWWNTSNYSNTDKKPFNDFDFQAEVLRRFSVLGLNTYGGEVNDSSEIKAISGTNVFSKRDFFVDPTTLKRGFNTRGFLEIIEYVIERIENH